MRRGKRVVSAAFFAFVAFAVCDVAVAFAGGCTPTTGSTGDRAAQSNLTNALTEASALYDEQKVLSTGSFTGGVTATFEASAPEFTWTRRSCDPMPQNCISYAVYDADKPGDAQVLVLADFMNGFSTCWYIATVETAPKLPQVTGGGRHELGIPREGTWYAKSGTNKTACSATDPVRFSYHRWFASYSSVDANG